MITKLKKPNMEDIYHSVFVNKGNKLVNLFSDRTEQFNVLPETFLVTLEVVTSKYTLKSYFVIKNKKINLNYSEIYYIEWVLQVYNSLYNELDLLLQL